MAAREVFFLNVEITHPGGWMQSGVMHSIYTRDASGWYEKISNLHYYCRHRGRDIYPPREKLKAMLDGEKTVLGLKEWA